jgi:hypothetical protein
MNNYNKLYKIFIALLEELGDLHLPNPENDPKAMCIKCRVKYPCKEITIMIDALMEMDRYHEPS